MPLTELSTGNLSPRLKAIADSVPECRRLLDIGTDHAWLPIKLMQAGRCREAVAIDIRPGPLAIAARHILSSGLEGRIILHQADGLQGIDLDSEDVVVLAGLGGCEIIKILAKQPCKCLALVLQPMKSLPELRTWLCSQGYNLDDERLAIEPKHAYVVIRCHFTGNTVSLDPLDELVGPVLRAVRPPGLAIYLGRLLVRLHKQKRGDPALIPLISRIEQLQAEIAGRSDA